MRFLPLFFDLSQGPVILVGAGKEAIAKLRILKAAAAQIRWYVLAREAIDESDAQDVDLRIGLPADEDFLGVIALVASAGTEIDEQLAARARAMNVPVNVVDRPDLSTFIFPSIVDRGDVVVAIGTGGTSPVLARRLREKIEQILPERIGEFAGLMGRHRERLNALRHRGFSTRQFWERVIDGPIGALFLAGRSAKAEAALIIEIERAGLKSPAQGHVQIVGAGPGDPDLLTLKAFHALQSADIVLTDDLVSSEILSRVRRDAEIVHVGKRKGHMGIGQEAINRRLIAEAKAGRNVVRLKGGDPFIFGRGGEEREALEAEGIPVTDRARHHRGTRLRGGGGCAADDAQGGDTAFDRDREHRRRRGQDRLDRPGRPHHHGRDLYGTDRGGSRAQRIDRLPDAIHTRRSRCWRAARARIRAASPARCRNCRHWRPVQVRGPR